MKKTIDILGAVVTVGCLIYSIFDIENRDTFLATAFATGFATGFLNEKIKMKEVSNSNNELINENDKLSKLVSDLTESVINEAEQHKQSVTETSNENTDVSNVSELKQVSKKAKSKGKK